MFFFSSLLVVKVEIVLSLQSAILLHTTLSLEINAHLGPCNIAWSGDPLFYQSGICHARMSLVSLQFTNHFCSPPKYIYKQL